MSINSSKFILPLNNRSVGVGNKPNNATMELPIDMQFNDGNLLSVIVYSFLLGISAVGNLSVLKSIIRIRMKARLNRMNLLVMHLAIADLLVTFLMMPAEIAWNITVAWKGGDFMCRLMSFFRTFGLYLSSFIVICISFDRYFAVLKPLALPDANRRGRVMLYVAWIGSAVCSLPQAWVFRLEHHPIFTWYEQCTTLLTFTSKAAELTYNYFGFACMYGIPMLVIIFCYGSILREVYKVFGSKKNGETLRRSSNDALGRAKIGTLKMTVIIVTTFFFCWTPYNVMSLWYWIDRESALQVDQRVQKCLFLFAVSNSCVNPLIYGIFRIRNDKRAAVQEIRLRQTLAGVGNHCQLEQINRPPYGLRVRWKPRECLCPSASASSSGGDHYTNRPGIPSSRTRGSSPYTHTNGRQQALNNPSQNRYPSGNVPRHHTHSPNSNLMPLTSREMIRRHLPNTSMLELDNRVMVKLNGDSSLPESVLCSTSTLSSSLQKPLSSNSRCRANLDLMINEASYSDNGEIVLQRNKGGGSCSDYSDEDDDDQSEAV